MYFKGSYKEKSKRKIAKKPWQIKGFGDILVRNNGYDEDSSRAVEIQSESGMVRARREYGTVKITSELQSERVIE